MRGLSAGESCALREQAFSGYRVLREQVYNRLRALFLRRACIQQ